MVIINQSIILWKHYANLRSQSFRFASLDLHHHLINFDVRYKFAMHIYRTRFSSFCFDLEHALKLIHAFMKQYLCRSFLKCVYTVNKKSLSNLVQTTGFNCREYVQGRVQIRSVNSWEYLNLFLPGFILLFKKCQPRKEHR